MRKMEQVAVVLAFPLMAAGCFEHTYTIGAGAPAGPVVYEEWQNQWLGGLIGERTHAVVHGAGKQERSDHYEDGDGIKHPTTLLSRRFLGVRSQAFDLTSKMSARWVLST